MFRQCHRLVDALGEACKICKGESHQLHLSVGKVPDSTWPAGKLMQKLVAYDHEAWASHAAAQTRILGAS